MTWRYELFDNICFIFARSRFFFNVLFPTSNQTKAKQAEVIRLIVASAGAGREIFHYHENV